MRRAGVVVTAALLLALVTSALAAAPGPWEYAVAAVRPLDSSTYVLPSPEQVAALPSSALILPSDLSLLSQALNLLARQGWELSSVTVLPDQNTQLILRRPFTGAAPVPVAREAFRKQFPTPPGLTDLDERDYQQRVTAHAEGVVRGLNHLQAGPFGPGLTVSGEHLNVRWLGLPETSEGNPRDAYSLSGTLTVEAGPRLLKGTAYRETEAQALARQVAQAVQQWLQGRGESVRPQFLVEVTVQGHPVARDAVPPLGGYPAPPMMRRPSPGSPLVDLDQQALLQRVETRDRELTAEMSAAVAKLLPQGLRLVGAGEWQDETFHQLGEAPPRLGLAGGHAIQGHLDLDATARLLHGENGYRRSEAEALANSLVAPLTQLLKDHKYTGSIEFALSVKGSTVASGATTG